MSDAQEILTDIYNTLVQIRYPKITIAEAKDVESTILNGKNRISLLSWLLTEKSPCIDTRLKNLKGPLLEAELFKCYSEIGICIHKNLLLGNCTLQEQLPTLKLLLDFMKCIHIECPITIHKEKEPIINMLQVCTSEDSKTMISDIEPTLSYSESIQYFENVRNYLDKHQESLSNYDLEKEEDSMEEHLIQTMDNKSATNEDGNTSLFNTEKKKFIEAFSTIKLPMFAGKNNLFSIDAHINDIHSNFTSLIQFQQAKNEILNVSIPKGLDKLNTPLSKLTEDILIATEETKNMYTDD